MLAAVIQNGHALRFASAARRDDDKVIVAAMLPIHWSHVRTLFVGQADPHSLLSRLPPDVVRGVILVQILRAYVAEDEAEEQEEDSGDDSDEDSGDDSDEDFTDED